MAAAARPMGAPGAGGYAQLLALRRANTGLNPTPPAAIYGLVNSTYGRPLTDPQISGTARLELDPLLAAAAGQIGDQANRATAQIGANSSALATRLAGMNFGAPYDTAKQEQAAVDAVLQGSLAGTGGTALAGDLRSRLGQIDDPTVDTAATGVAGRGAAIGTTELAHGSAALDNLIAAAAGAKEYGAKLPGIAQLTGLQGMAGIQSKAVDDVAAAKTAILNQLPTVVNELRTQNDNVRGNRASMLMALLGQNITKRTAQVGLQGAQSKAAAPDATLSRAYGYAVDSNGNPVGGNVTPLPGYTVDPGGTVVKTPKPAPAAKPLSSSALHQLNTQADVLYNGIHPKLQFNTQTQQWMHVPGTGQAPVHWSDAVAQLVAAGASHDQAVKLLTAQGWQPGEGGRPYKSKVAEFNATRSQVPKIGQTSKGADGAIYVYRGLVAGWVKK